MIIRYHLSTISIFPYNGGVVWLTAEVVLCRHLREVYACADNIFLGDSVALWGIGKVVLSVFDVGVLGWKAAKRELVP